MSLFSAAHLARVVPHQRRYSFLAVGASTTIGLLFPQQAGMLLAGPLAVGLVGLGIAHGACDQLVVPAAGGQGRLLRSWRYWLHFLGTYLGLAAAVGLLWWHWPALAVGLFFALTVWHWGSADAPTDTATSAGEWLVASLLRGLLLFAVPAWWWPAQTAAIVNGLLHFTGAPGVAPGAFANAVAGLGGAVLAGQLGLWAWYARRRRFGQLLAGALEVAVLAALLVVLPPRLSVAVYFVFWHSLQHVLRLNGWLGYVAADRPALVAQLRFFLRRAAPLLLLICLALLSGALWLAAWLPNAAAWFSFALVVASIVTLPHALLVTCVMDARQWRKRLAAGSQPRQQPTPGL